ncbi:MAG TPA: PUA domain-containing protein [Candidatus Nanoarchaeia archaeon]|nr:PUA domain-containing protein [Candidatus Nanoarchaeia archaeon]
MKTTHLRSKEVSLELKPYGIDLSKKDTVMKVHFTPAILLINREPSFFDYNGHWVPTLKYLQKNNVLKTITIDVGAIKFVINGADVMRPGIKSINNSICENEPIAIIDDKNKKVIAVGLALFKAPDMDALKNGRAVKNIHYVGDEIWKNDYK